MCSEKFETIERMIARSSTHWPTCGNKSLTGMPLSPYCRNFHGQPSTLPTLLNCVGWVLTLIGCPCSRSRRGLGSNVSICDGPPSMNRKMTLRGLRREVRRPGRQRVRARRTLAVGTDSAGASPTTAPNAGARKSDGQGQRAKTAAASQQHVAAAQSRFDKASAVHGKSGHSGRSERRSSSVNEDKLFHIDQAHGTGRPRRASSASPAGPACPSRRACRLAVEERQARAGFLIGRPAAEGRLVKLVEPLAGRSAGPASTALGPEPGLADDQRDRS